MTVNRVGDNEEFSATHWSSILNGVGLEYILSGCTPTKGTGNFDVDVAAGSVLIAGSSPVTFAGDTVTLTTPDPTNPRVDLVTIDTGGVLDSVDGTPASDPEAPDIPANEVVIAVVEVAAGASSIVAGDIHDYRVPGMITGYPLRTADIAADAITTAKVADDAITAALIATGAVTADGIASGAVGQDEIGNNAVGLAEVDESAGSADELLGTDGSDPSWTKIGYANFLANYRPYSASDTGADATRHSASVVVGQSSTETLLNISGDRVFVGGLLTESADVGVDALITVDGSSWGTANTLAGPSGGRVAFLPPIKYETSFKIDAQNPSGSFTTTARMEGWSIS